MKQTFQNQTIPDPCKFKEKISQDTNIIRNDKRNNDLYLKLNIPSRHRSPNQQKQINLNLIKNLDTIQQMKPKTAVSKQKYSFQIKKDFDTKRNIMSKNTAKSIENKAKLRLTTLTFEHKGTKNQNIKALIKNDQNIQNKNRLNQLQPIDSQQNHKINQKYTIQQKMKRQTSRQKSQQRRLVRIKKRKSQHILPQPKISINNIYNTLVNNKLQDKQKKNVNYKKLKPLEMNQKTLQHQSQIQNTQEQIQKNKQSQRKKKTKKDNQIPDFIKLSLKNYYQQFNPKQKSLDKIEKNRNKIDDSKNKLDQSLNNTKIDIQNLEQNNIQPLKYDFISTKTLISSKNRHGCQSSELKKRKYQFRSISIENKKEEKQIKNKKSRKKLDIEEICAWKIEGKNESDLCFKS